MPAVFEVKPGVHQGCGKSLLLFNLVRIRTGLDNPEYPTTNSFSLRCGADAKLFKNRPRQLRNQFDNLATFNFGGEESLQDPTSP